MHPDCAESWPLRFTYRLCFNIYCNGIAMGGKQGVDGLAVEVSIWTLSAATFLYSNCTTKRRVLCAFASFFLLDDW
jgi:hypothetical protein